MVGTIAPNVNNNQPDLCTFLNELEKAMIMSPALYALVEFSIALRPDGVATVNNTLTLSSDPVSTSGLKYWDTTRNTWTVANTDAGNQNNMATGDVLYCAELGKMRFDTRLVRNLVWFVQLQRIMRVVLTDHLKWINTPVVRGLKIADAKITEFNGNDKYTDDDFNGNGKYSLM